MDNYSVALFVTIYVFADYHNDILFMFSLPITSLTILIVYLLIVNGFKTSFIFTYFEQKRCFILLKIFTHVENSPNNVIDKVSIKNDSIKNLFEISKIKNIMSVTQTQVSTTVIRMNTVFNILYIHSHINEYIQSTF